MIHKFVFHTLFSMGEKHGQHQFFLDWFETEPANDRFRNNMHGRDALSSSHCVLGYFTSEK